MTTAATYREESDFKLRGAAVGLSLLLYLVGFLLFSQVKLTVSRVLEKRERAVQITAVQLKKAFDVKTTDRAPAAGAKKSEQAASPSIARSATTADENAKKSGALKGLMALRTSTYVGTSLPIDAVPAPGEHSLIHEKGLGLKEVARDVSTKDLATLPKISGQAYQGEFADQIETSLQTEVFVPRYENVEVEVKGAMDPALLESFVKEHLIEMRYCYETNLLKVSDLQGKILTSWTIAGDGRVLDFDSASSDISLQSLHACLREKISQWTFPAPKGGGVVHVKYPFIFSRKTP